jgi:hypothetical protein
MIMIDYVYILQMGERFSNLIAVPIV